MSAVERSSPPAPGPIRPLQIPRPERRSLANGLAVLATRHGDLPLVTVELVVDAGAAGDPAGRAGLAKLTTAALETGTAHHDADRIAWELERLGIELDADAGWDAATVRITMPRQHLEAAMSLFAEMVQRPAFAEGEVNRLRDEQVATLLQRSKDPGAMASDAAARYLFPQAVPYARPLIGTAASVENLTVTDVRAFHQARFRPDAATLIFVGDIDPPTAATLAERHFGGWETGRVEPPGFDVASAVETRTIFIVDRPDAVQSEIRILDVGVERGHPDYYPLLVMNTVLGGAFTSRLNMSLRERHGFTYGVRSGFACRRRPGPFVVQAAVATEVTAAAVREALHELTSLRENGATEDEVRGARDYLAGILPLQLQTTGQLAARLAEIVIYDLPDDQLHRYRDLVGAVTADDVARVARTHLRLERLAIVVVGDAARISPELESLGEGPVLVEVVN